MFFDDIRITLYFELRMEITFQLRFVFYRQCDVFLLRHNHILYLFVVVTFLMTLELRFFIVRSNYVLKLRHRMVFLVTFVCNKKPT